MPDEPGAWTELKNAACATRLEGIMAGATSTLRPCAAETECLFKSATSETSLRTHQARSDSRTQRRMHLRD
jgi:hypothetical protein